MGPAFTGIEDELFGEVQLTLGERCLQHFRKPLFKRPSWFLVTRGQYPVALYRDGGTHIDQRVSVGVEGGHLPEVGASARVRKCRSGLQSLRPVY